MRRIDIPLAPANPARSAWSPLLFAVALALLFGGCDSLVEVDNPNDVLEDALRGESKSAVALANGSLANTAQALSQVLIASITMTDETDWVGSQNGAGELERGQIYTNANSYMTQAFNDLSTARWLSDYTIELLEGFDAEGELTNRAYLGQAYLYAGINYETIASMFDDFAFSDRREAGAPIGEQNMHMVYDSAVVRLDRAIQIAREVGDGDLELAALAMRARTKWAKALWYKLNPKGSDMPGLTDPLVNDADANADAEAVLAMAGADWEYRFFFSSGAIDNDVAGWVNSRHEVVFNDEFAKWDESRLEICSPFNDECPENGIRLVDPIDEIKDPAFQGIIFEFIEGGEYSPLTVVSVREMHLILAEAALAASGGAATPDFVQHINAVRALEDGLTPYDPGVHSIAPIELLKHERLVNLFLQTRRLADMYRFQEPADEWVTNSEARTIPGTFFMMGQEEVLANCHIIGTC